MGRPTVAKIDLNATKLVRDVNVWFQCGRRKDRPNPQAKLDETCTIVARNMLESIFPAEFKRFNRLRRPEWSEFPKAVFDSRYPLVLFAFLWAYSVASGDFIATSAYLHQLENSSKIWLTEFYGTEKTALKGAGKKMFKTDM